MTQTKTIPDGYLEDAQGRLVPVGSIRPIDLARDDLVREKIAKIKAMQQELRDLKYELLGDIEAFVSMSAERYDVSIGGKKGNVTLASYDGRYTLKRQISENLTFDEGLQAAKAIIDDCLRAWTKDSAEEIRTLVDFAFQVDKEGCLNTGRILALRRLDIKDEQGPMCGPTSGTRTVAIRPSAWIWRRCEVAAWKRSICHLSLATA